MYTTKRRWWIFLVIIYKKCLFFFLFLYYPISNTRLRKKVNNLYTSVLHNRESAVIWKRGRKPLYNMTSPLYFWCCSVRKKKKEIQFFCWRWLYYCENKIEYGNSKTQEVSSLKCKYFGCILCFFILFFSLLLYTYFIFLFVKFCFLGETCNIDVSDISFYQ